MGWSDCGVDSQERPIGYGFTATYDYPGCGAKIDRGIAYVCGFMHGKDEFSCDKYFCEAHKVSVEIKPEFRNTSLPDHGCIGVCKACAGVLADAGLLVED